MDVPTDWTPGAAALGVAAAIGVLVALRIRARAPASASAAAPADSARKEELSRQRDALYEQIRALDADTGWRPEDRALARQRLVVDAAETLRALEGVDAPVPSAPPAPPARAGSPWVNAVIGLSAGVFGAALVLGIQSYTKPKEQPAPMAAAAPPVAAGPSPAMTQRVAMRKAAVDANPDDLAARLAYARALVDADEVKEAFSQTQKITEAQPDNADARTLQAVILLQIGDVTMATGLLDKVLSAHPDHVEALGYRGAIYLNAGQKDEAIAAWQKVIQLDPTQQAAVEPLIEMARTGRNPFGSAPVTGGASGSAAGGMGEAAPAAAGPTPSDITGTVTYSGSAPHVFIYLRPAGVDRGPPAAVKKLQNPTFPLDFRIGPGDSPMGGPFPEDGTLTVRVDLDGNPTTHEDGAPEVRVEHVKPGQTDVKVGL